MTTPSNTSTSLVRSSTDITLPDGTKRYCTVEMQITVHSGASDADIAQAIQTATRTITMAQESVQSLLNEQVASIRVAHQPTDQHASPVVRDEDIVISFGKNKGVPLGHLSENQLKWYAYDMTSASPEATVIREAAQRLFQALSEN